MRSPRERSSPGELRTLLIVACPFPCRRGTPARPLAQLGAFERIGIVAQVVTYHLGQGELPPGARVHRIPTLPTYRRTSAGPSFQKLAVLDPLLLRRTLQVAREFRPHVLHGHHVEGGLVALAAGKRLGLPVVFDAHTSLQAELPSHLPALPAEWLGGIGACIDRFLARRSRHVIAVSEPLREYLLANAAGIPDESVTVVPTPVERDELPEGALAREPGAEGRPTVVFAGGFKAFQRLDLLREAFERVLGAIPDAKLLIVSNDPLADLERAWPGAASHPSVEIVEPSDLTAVFACLARSDVAASPRTSTGGLPQKVLNYMAAALPVVASEGSASAVRHGETGWVVPNDDARGFAEAVVALLRDRCLRHRLGRAGRRTVRGKYAGADLDRRLRGVYETVLAFERRPPEVCLQRPARDATGTIRRAGVVGRG